MPAGSIKLHRRCDNRHATVPPISQLLSASSQVKINVFKNLSIYLFVSFSLGICPKKLREILPFPKLQIKGDQKDLRIQYERDSDTTTQESLVLCLIHIKK